MHQELEECGEVDLHQLQKMIIEFVTIASTGDATDFGDLQSTRLHMAAAGNQTRGIFAGGENGPSDVDIIDYVTIASTGNSIDFGDLPSSQRWLQQEQVHQLV